MNESSQDTFFSNLKLQLASFKEKVQKKYAQLKEKHPLGVKAMWILSGTFVAGIIGILIFVLMVYKGAFGPIPDYAALKSIRNNTASQVYSDDGKLLGKFFIENRLHADIDEISPFVNKALVATEDARFFQHSGIDLRAWGRVFLRTVLMGDESGGGGSTLSQQLVKNLFPRDYEGWWSIPVFKMKEVIVARRLERLYSKEELLNLYLNTVPFGENIFGIKVASQRFFNTTPAKLGPEQAATLVGMLKANTYYNPVRNPENARGRRNTVLYQMHKYGYLKKPALDSLSKLPLITDYQPEGDNKGLATYFREQIRLEAQELIKDAKKPDGNPYNLYTDGLKVYTTIDSRLQAYAEYAVAQQMKTLQEKFDTHWKGRNPWGSDKGLKVFVEKTERYKNMKAAGFSESQIDSAFNEPIQMTLFSWKEDFEKKKMSPLDSLKYNLSLLQSGFLAMDPHTGEIKAWVGGIDHRFFKYDHVKSRRQVGSTFKPLVYAAALENGMQPCEYFENQLFTYPDYEDWTPENADGEYGGYYSMAGGLSNSVNTVSVAVLLESGIEPVVELGHKMGIQSDIPEVPSIALGTPEISLWEMVNVFGAFANEGKTVHPRYLKRIETADGIVLKDFSKDLPKSERVLSEETAAMMTHLLQSVVDSGTGKRLRYEFGLSNDIAGKTGTTQDQSDGWFIGYSPDLVAGAWVGGEFPQIRFRSLSLGQGSATALPIFGRFMDLTLKDKNYSRWKKSTFPPLQDSLLAKLDCEPWRENPPLEQQIGEDFEWLTDLLDVFNKNKKDSLEQVQSREVNQKSPGQMSERSREIKRHNERVDEKREKKKKRKEFWDKVFGRD
ncbi:MAG: transglycosylase domain-containing protein [Saprospiraceae bacterium]